MLALNSLPPRTRAVFDALAGNPRMGGFTLIGGTALALQIDHRKSEDLDFWLPAGRLDKSALAAIVRDLKQRGLRVEPATAHDRIVQARINGVDLLAVAQDYAINGSKVTFFTRNDDAFMHFDTFARLTDSGTAFRILGQEGVFAMKSYVIHKRARSRDLFDLMTFVKAGKTIGDILRAAADADPACLPEYAKSVLTGLVPLDKDDEGFDTVGVQVSVEEIYRFFSHAIDAHEQRIALDIYRSMGKPERA